MRIKILFILWMFVFTAYCYAQDNEVTFQGNFTAIIVKDIQNSITWYENNFGFTVVNQTTIAERGLKQANLEFLGNRLELIELSTSVDITEGGSKRILAQGIFKIGFTVSNFETWEDRFLDLNLITENDVVTDPITAKKMFIVKDPDGNRIQIFEN